jgi:ParB/RepB/Spo0J family partition protein
LGERARLRAIASGRRDAFNIDPKLIKIDAHFNPRQYTLYENRQHLDTLKMSIAEVGVLMPLLVRWDGEQAVLIDGECRLRACLELIKEGIEIKTVPVLQETAGDEAQRLVLALSANTGKPLSLLESGAAYKRLERFGWSHDEIAKRVGTTRAKVSAAIEIAQAPTDVKEMVSKGEVTPALAKQVVRAKGDKAGAVLREKIAETKAGGKKIAKREASSPKAKFAPGLDELVEVGDLMAELIGERDDEHDSQLGRAMRKWNRLRGL